MRSHDNRLLDEPGPRALVGPNRKYLFKNRRGVSVSRIAQHCKAGLSVLTQFDGSMVKYLDGSVEDSGERIKQEVVFAGTWCLKRLLEVSGDGDLKKTVAA